MTLKDIKCPTCERPSTFSPTNKYRPFCSDRCKLIDLGEWGSEGYKIPVKESTVQEWEDKSTQS